MILRIYQYFCGLFHEKCQQNNLYIFSNYVINNHVNGYVQFICTNPIEISLSILLKLIKLVVKTRYFAEFFLLYTFQRWASKWGIRTSLLLSSLLFGVGHANVLGATVVGLVFGILYIKRDRYLYLLPAVRGFPPLSEPVGENYMQLALSGQLR